MLGSMLLLALWPVSWLGTVNLMLWANAKVEPWDRDMTKFCMIVCIFGPFGFIFLGSWMMANFWKDPYYHI